MQGSIMGTSTGGPGAVEALGTISRHSITTGPVTILTVPDTSDGSDGRWGNDNELTANPQVSQGELKKGQLSQFV
jgi:hypothetical protein